MKNDALEAARAAWEADKFNPEAISGYISKLAAAAILGLLGEAETKARLSVIRDALRAEIANPEFCDMAEALVSATANRPLPAAVVTQLVHELIKAGVKPGDVAGVDVFDLDSDGVAISVRRAKPSDGIGEPVGHA